MKKQFKHQSLHTRKLNNWNMTVRKKSKTRAEKGLLPLTHFYIVIISA